LNLPIWIPLSQLHGMDSSDKPVSKLSGVGETQSHVFSPSQPMVHNTHVVLRKEWEHDSDS